MKHTPDSADVQRMIDRSVRKALTELVEFLGQCAAGNADQNLSRRDLEHVAACIKDGRWTP